MTKHAYKPGDIVTVDDDAAEWLILALAPRDTGERCECVKPEWRRTTYTATSTTVSHERHCGAIRRGLHYWLQNVATGALYRPHGHDEAVSKDRLTLVTPYKLPTRRELAQLALI